MDMILLFGGFAIVMWAQLKVSGNYNKYKQVANKNGKSGAEVAREMLDKAGLSNLYIVETKGELTDHYDPRQKVVRLSTDIYHGKTIAAISVAAHECGHAIQDKEGYSFMRIRAALVPFVNFISYAGYFGLVISLFAGITSYIMISILVLLSTLLFQLVTLPVEFDASKRALVYLKKEVDKKEQKGCQDMLSAAAFTYVAGLISTLLQLIRLIAILGNRNE